MPKVIYENFLRDTLLYTTMCLQLVDQSLCYPKGILEDVYVRVENSYVLVDFMVVETRGDERSPIILERPFLNTAKAIIYTSNAKIYFTIDDRKEKFSFKKKTLKTPAHPQMAYTYEDKTTDKKKKKNKSKNNPKQPQAKAVRMINTVHVEYDHLLVSPFLTKQDDPRVPTIHCSINQPNFQKTFCDTRSSVNIMAKVTYQLIFGKEPLHPTYMQLQMADQTF
jgi:hypothetical protein